MKTAVVTGASKGLGLAAARALADHGWTLVITARGASALEDARRQLAQYATVVAIPGDVAESGHRAALVRAAAESGGASLLLNNASTLGASPLPPLENYDLDELRRVYEVDVIAPLALTQQLLPQLRQHRGVVINVSSDAAVEAYEGWGGYGSAKAALDQLSAVLAVEQPSIRVYAFDPGDMRTEMHQLAYPGEDISDRPEPETVVPALLQLLDGVRPGGRYQAAQLEPIEAPG
jgi:NAD(P)-dependent dehydrogenase (short-subunit alcohol dehydrogenase family)